MPKAPSGQPTRGKTALNRLRQVDTYIALAWSHILTHGSPLVVDVGYGAQAWTALEMYERWLPFNPHLRLLGVEIDPERVAAAQPYGQPGVIDFKLGGFNLKDILGGEQARVIRAYNVLRQYSEADVPAALHMMGEALQPGGILIEGTSTPTGRMVAFDLYRKLSQSGIMHSEIIFGTNFHEAVDPVDFRAILPKRLIHHAYDEAPARFFEFWGKALALARGAGKTGRRERWIYAAHVVKTRYPLDIRMRIVRRGYLVLRDPLLTS
jgi:hypothetical protein